MATKTKDSVLAELATLGASLGEDAEDAAQQQATLKQILGAIDGLDKETARDLFKNERVQRLIELASESLAQDADTPPGFIPSGVPFAQKKPWAEADLNRLIERGELELVKNFRPQYNRVVIWNGLTRHFRARQPINCPKCFIDVYEESLNAEQLAEQHAAFLFRKVNSLDDRSVLTENGLRARGTGDSGHYVPGGGLITLQEREDAGT